MTDLAEAARQAMGLWVMHAEPGSDLFDADAPDVCWVPPGPGGHLVTDSAAHGQWIVPDVVGAGTIVPNVSTMVQHAQLHLQRVYYRRRGWRDTPGLLAEVAVDLTRIDPADMGLLMGRTQFFGVPTTLVERPPVGADRGVAIEVVVYPGPDADPDVSGQVAAIVAGGQLSLTNTMELVRRLHHDESS